jgi:endonuclease/exonuclease/phosphatase family metal-dependent hydrolase
MNLKHLTVFLIYSFLSYEGFASTRLSVLWWNIGYNHYSLPINDYSKKTNLEETLEGHDWSDYDVVALGEYIEGTLPKESLDELKKHFKWSKIIKYNSAYDKSIYILSKYDFTYTAETIDWVNPNWSLNEISRYRKSSEFFYGSTKTFKRKYLRIKLNKDGKDNNLVFYHFNNPWPGLKRLFGKYLTAAEILTGRDNPLYNQILQFEDKLKKDLGLNYKNKRVLIMGDSNCPRTIKGIKPVCYNKLGKILTLRVDKNKENTFPALKSTVSGKYPDVKIDHIQTSESLGRATVKVLKLNGSDHYPIHLKTY